MGVCCQFTCLICKEKGLQKHYLGESARAMFDRLQEHAAAIRNKSLESPLYEHHPEEHNGEDPQFSLKILGFYKRPLQRQSMEGLLIGEAKEGTFMNRRGEWGQNLPPKLEVVDPDEEFRPQEKTKTKRKPKTQSPATKDDPGGQKLKR